MDEDFEDVGSGKDFLVEQRSTERYLNDIKTSGFRDGHQEYLENEELIQTGFDNSYKLFTKLAFQIGELRSISSVLVKDSCFLAKLDDKLRKIENFNYEIKLDWNKDETSLLPNFDLVKNAVKNFETKLDEMKEILYSNENSKSLMENLNDLVVLENENLDLGDEEELRNKKNVDLLNNLVEGWNF